MIDLYFWPTPNGHKITLMLEETGLPYTIHPINIGKGDQFAPDFLKISPNNKMPAIVDHEPGDGDQPGGGGPLSIFESGAILLYLAKKAKRFAGETLRERVTVKEWLFWQVGGLGPMTGQMMHFVRFAPEQVPYGIKRYTDETQRLLGVLDRRLAESEFTAGANYSVADMSSYPWVRAVAALGLIDDHAHVARWVEAIGARPATIAAYTKGEAVSAPPPADAPKP
ncbi:glutathione S-transferase N-terminal domain-containing protein [Polymorphobacter sp. PAMC 29334]|uniref:glutathione S-transferase N-terminal domain-containing protein n=1 Tax=Polymorphobacter sp. PAMC 29334 TaxID=2862331 RepID=UPI001C742C94|nr:glutathione S-transferase N-terminal domain-containing protein [Polymorphobacter sp. PAMC 29334]QYE35568.1 glutathione S-transferase N-terminal domain-containing protein [Polymorphobacter sp. PAMC 29334]